MKPLVSLADVKAYLGISTTEYDVFLQNQIEVVSEAIQLFCRRDLIATDFKEIFYADDARLSGSPRNVLTLDQYPVIEISDINEVYGPDNDPTESEVVDYRLNKPVGKIMNFNYLPAFSRGSRIVVEYRAGYETLPPLLKSVVMDLIKERYNKKSLGIDLSFGTDVQRVNIPGTIGIDFDYSLQNNESSTPFGSIIGNYANLLTTFRSDRAVLGNDRLVYLERVG
jgi:hypothetical protein